MVADPADVEGWLRWVNCKRGRASRSSERARGKMREKWEESRENEKG